MELNNDKPLTIVDILAAKKAQAATMQINAADAIAEAAQVQPAELQNLAQLDSIAQANELLANAEPIEALKQAEKLNLEEAAEHIAEIVNPIPPKVHHRSLKEMIEAKKKLAEAQALAIVPAPLPATIDAFVEEKALAQEYQGQFSLSIELNEKQLLAKEFALSGRNFCLIGAAGTGKTTTQRSVAETLLESESLSTTSFKPQGGSGERVVAPSIAFVAYTRRASSNLQRAIHKNPRLEEALFYNVMTIHALLEFRPVTYLDEEGKERFRFEPQKHTSNKLSITHLVIEEASMVGLDLWRQLYDALPEGVQIIFIGDINQLPQFLAHQF